MNKRFLIIGIALITVFCFLGVACESDNSSANDSNLASGGTPGGGGVGTGTGGTQGGGSYYLSSNAPSEPQAFNDITAAQLVAGMTIGWNLGNTLDASGDETSWVSHRTNKSNIDAIKNAGFNTIRIPVTWYKSAAMNMSTFDINHSWMDRVTEIVNYAVANDMYIIINTHHDEGIFKFGDAQGGTSSAPKPAVALSENEKRRSLEAFQKIWAQIAYNFRNYNEKLIFEGLNEPRTKGSTGEWNGGTDHERAVLNEYYKVFVDTVRASGGNNDKRILSINTYAASAWGTAVNALVLPNDTVPNKLVVQIHAYEPYNFALNNGASAVSTFGSDGDKAQVRETFNAANNKFVRNGVPVIMGEFGAMNRDNDDAREAWAEYYVGHAKSLGIPCIVWDNGAFTGGGERFALINRTNNTFPNPKYLDGLLRGAGVK